MYRFFLFLTIYLNLTNSLVAKLCLDAGSGSAPVKHIKVMSERCSGSYYVESLLKTNIENLNSIGGVRYGLKHFNPWFGYESSYYGPKQDYTFEGSEDILFVIIFRNPYDWLRSFQRTAFFGPPKTQTCDFSEFIRTEWGINTSYEQVREWQKFHPLIELNPSNGLPFKNVIKLRAAKIKNMLEIPKRIQNYYIVNYEQVKDHPEQVVKEVSEIFRLDLKAEFTPIVKIRGFKNAGIYVPIKYNPISKKDLLYINQQLDEQLENSIGYKLNKQNSVVRVNEASPD